MQLSRAESFSDWLLSASVYIFNMAYHYSGDAFHSIKAVVSQVGALLLLNKYITATQWG